MTIVPPAGLGGAILAAMSTRQKLNQAPGTGLCLLEKSQVGAVVHISRPCWFARAVN